MPKRRTHIYKSDAEIKLNALTANILKEEASKLALIIDKKKKGRLVELLAPHWINIMDDYELLKSKSDKEKEKMQENKKINNDNTMLMKEWCFNLRINQSFLLSFKPKDGDRMDIRIKLTDVKVSGVPSIKGEIMSLPEGDSYYEDIAVILSFLHVGGPITCNYKNDKYSLPGFYFQKFRLNTPFDSGWNYAVDN
jgi:hypothetical protein